MAFSGYDYPDSYRAENLTAGYETAAEAFEAWRTSPGHDVNMLDAKQKVIGIARIHDPDSYYGWYWTMDFGSELDSTSHARERAPPSREPPETSRTVYRCPNMDGEAPATPGPTGTKTEPV